MKDPKKLAFILSVLQSLPTDNDTESFWREVAKLAGNAISKDKSNIVGDWFSAITVEDIHRIKQYLTLRDRILKINAKRFYEKIRDPDLKRELILDFREMKVALLDNDMLEYGRRMAVQLECCFNKVLISTDAWAEVNKNPSRYIEERGSLSNRYSFDLSNKLFNNGVNKKISEIEFITKYEYAQMYHKFKANKIFINLNILRDIKFIRDKSSHRGEATTEEIDRLERLIKNPEGMSARFADTFYTIIENLHALH